MRDPYRLAVVDAHERSGLSSLSSAYTPRPNSSDEEKPVIAEPVMSIVVPVALNQPGNFRTAPFFIAKWLFAPETVKASLRYGLIASVCVVTIELSRTSSPPAFTLSA